MTSPATITIDLGAADRPPDLAAADERAPAGLPRGWGLLVALLSVALVSTAAPVPRPPREVARIQLGVGDFRLTDAGLFLLRAVTRPATVTSVDPADGQERWTYSLDGRSDVAGVTSVGGVVLLATGPCAGGQDSTTTALDAHTGRSLWQREGTPLAVPAAAPVAVLVDGAWTDRCGALTGNGRPLIGTLRFTGLDRSTGAVRWSVSAPRGTILALDDDAHGAGWVAMVDGDQRLSILDLATGTISAGMDLGGRPAALAASHDLVLARRGADVVAFDRNSLGPRWSVRIEADQNTVLSIGGCGLFVCVVGDDTTALDPVTGAERWHAARTQITDVPGALYVDDTFGTGDPTDAGATKVVLADPATGRRAISLDGWRLLATDEAGGRVLVADTGAEATVLAWLTTAGLQPLAAVPARFDSCQVSADRLACQTNIDELWLMKLTR